MSDMVETMTLDTSVLGASWHGKENPMGDARTAKEVCDKAGINWPVGQQQIPAWNAYIPHPEIPGAFIQNPALESPFVPGFKMNIRETDNTVLGFVSDVYQPIQNHEAFDFVDSIIGNEGAKYHSAGCLFNKYGRPTRIFITAQLKPISVLGDAIDNYLVFSHSHDGLNAVKVFVTPVRVVCHNTLTLATESAEKDRRSDGKKDKAPARYWSTKHTGDIKAKLNTAQETLHLYDQYMATLPAMAEKMNAINVYEEEFLQILDYLFPDDGTSGKSRMSQNAAAMRDKIVALHATKPDLEKFRYTAWGIYQAVIDVVEHVEPFRQTATAKINREFQIIEGHPVAARAQRALLSLQE